MALAYSYIDIAAMNGVRERFAAGDKLVLLDAALDKVLWANGAGARLFGFQDIESAVGSAGGLSPAAKRQVGATPGFSRGAGSQAMVRMGADAVPLHISRLSLPGRETAILLAASASLPGHRDEQELAARAIAGFGEPGQFLALVDHEAAVVAATPGFSALGVGRETLAELIAEVRTEPDRLVKRLVRGGVSFYPAGFARLTDDPLRHLLLIVDEPVASDRVEKPETESAGTGAHVKAADRSAGATGPGWPPKENTPVSPVVARSDAARETPANAHESASPTAIPAHVKQAEPTALPGAFDKNRPAVRFLWRTDPEGRFNAVSDEFLEAVGLTGADIVGKTFAEVALAFGLDPQHEIEGLLARRDTWSGRSVMWPVEGGWRAPVDLAALPAYSRDRTFEGFHGFGIIRFGDAVAPEPVQAPSREAEPQQDAIANADNIEDEYEDAPFDEADWIDETDIRRMDEEFPVETPPLEVEAEIEVEREPAPADEKVIHLAERRQPPVERVLSPVERNAFREIGNRLRGENGNETVQPASFGKRKVDDSTDAETVPHPRVVETPAHAAPFDKPAGHNAATGAGSGGTVVTAENGFGTPSRIVGNTPRTPAADVPTDPASAAGAANVDAAFSDREVLDRLPVPVLIHSGDTLYFANAELLDLTGYSSLQEIAAAGGLGALISTPFENQDEKREHQLHLRTKEGEEFPIDALLRSVPWGTGKALMLVVRRSGDIADEQETPSLIEARLRIAEMRAIIDTATDGVVLIDPDGSIRSISRPAEALFGFDSDELAGKPFASLFAIESQRAARDYLNGLADHGVASILNDGREVIGRESQGRFIPLFMTIGRLPNDSGYCAVVRDVTQWKRAEEELSQSRSQAEKASSQKSDFLARVSHEIRTPLNAIIGFSELMLDEKFGPVSNDRYRDYLRDINRSGNHVLDLVNDLLDISKIEAGEQEMSYEAVSLNETLAEVVAMMQPQANRERVIIRSSFATKLPEIVADLRSVRQIALNILSNAVRYTQAGGQVIISTAYEQNGEIAMRVRDTGIGMSPAEIEQALKPFKQINALKRARGDGTGLGLPLTKAMVEANRAKFTLTSAPNQGTLVEVIFPSTRVLAQ